VKWIVASAAVGAVRTEACRGPHPLLIAVMTATPTAAHNLFMVLPPMANERSVGVVE
jgi:hypothetical protein